jgi:hypothetical protein
MEFIQLGENKIGLYWFGINFCNFTISHIQPGQKQVELHLIYTIDMDYWDHNLTASLQIQHPAFKS